MEIIGWIGTVLMIVAYYPQIKHLYVEKCAWGISVVTWAIWLVASGFLLVYAHMKSRTLFVFVESINAAAIVATIVLAVRSNRICPFHCNVQDRIADARPGSDAV